MLEIFGRGYWLLRAIINLLALVGQCQAAALVPTQANTQSRFEILDVTRDGAGTDVELQFGHGKSAADAYCAKYLQQAQAIVRDISQ